MTATVEMPYKTQEAKIAYNREYSKTYRPNNREKLNALKRAWRLKNLEKSKMQAAEYARKYRKLYPERFKIYDKKNGENQRAKIRAWIRSLRKEMGGKCAGCGYEEVADILQFHHLRDKIKEVTRFNVEAEGREEAKKCILLCPNCHAIETLKALRS